MTFSSFYDPSHLYFVTASVIGWKHLFAKPEYAKIPLDSFAWLQQEKRILLFAFVIMPSHIHAILKPQNATIANILQQFGSYTAHELIHKLQEQKEKDFLALFQKMKRDRRHKHSVWQDIQAKNIYSLDVLQQKIEYIHQNPVSKDWKMAANRADYFYSSAGFYDYGRKPVIEITELNECLMSTPSPGMAKRAQE